MSQESRKFIYKVRHSGPIRIVKVYAEPEEKEESREGEKDKELPLQGDTKDANSE